MRIKLETILTVISFTLFSLKQGALPIILIKATTIPNFHTEAIQDSSLAPLTNEILQGFLWSEPWDELNCATKMEFDTQGIGYSWGCALISKKEFRYEVVKDTLKIEQYKSFSPGQLPQKWMGGNYIYTGRSLLLIGATEWDANGNSTEITLPRKREYFQKNKD